ncbi:hypothetical protein LguiA_026034 [Lonicera macranthoides]
MTTTTSPPTFQLQEKIDLTDEESHIFELLLQVVGHFNLQTQIRVVGGWVRDKIKCLIVHLNPEQSKHLETAKMHIDGIEIDFVNLRAEEYSENSCFPVVLRT